MAPRFDLVYGVNAGTFFAVCEQGPVLSSGIILSPVSAPYRSTAPTSAVRTHCAVSD